MIIGLKYWNEGGSPPVSFADWDVVTCYPRSEFIKYDEGVSELTGRKWNYIRRYLRVNIVFSPKELNNSSRRSTLETLLNATYFSVRDERHADLGSSNNIYFVRNDAPSMDRDSATLLSETATLDLITRDVV